MIHIDVTTSNDPLALGLYEFEFNYIYVGRSKKNDLILVDKDIPAMFLKIFIHFDGKEESLIVKNNLNDPYYFINGKKVSGSLKLKINDVISLGATKLKIIGFKKNDSDVELSEAYALFEAKAPELRPALEFIEEAIVDCEKMDQHV